MRLEKDPASNVELERFGMLAEYEARAHTAEQTWPWGEQLFTEEVMRRTKHFAGWRSQI